jgi:hypothetical protein
LPQPRCQYLLQPRCQQVPILDESVQIISTYVNPRNGTEFTTADATNHYYSEARWPGSDTS